jgi:hypothetical protein
MLTGIGEALHDASGGPNWPTECRNMSRAEVIWMHDQRPSERLEPWRARRETAKINRNASGGNNKCALFVFADAEVVVHSFWIILEKLMSGQPCLTDSQSRA